MYINFFFFFFALPFITKVYVSSSKCALIANNDGIFQFSLVSAIHHPLQLLVHAILSNQMLIVIRLFHGTKQFRIIQNGSFSINHSEEMMCQNNPHSNSLLPLHRSCHFVRFSPGIVAGSSLFSRREVRAHQVTMELVSMRERLQPLGNMEDIGVFHFDAFEKIRGKWQRIY